jgi:type I restriction enzyme S subunit
MMLYRPLPSVLNNKFMLFALQSEMTKYNLNRISGGSTVGHVRVGDIRDLFIPHCDGEEQLRICDLLGQADKAIEHSRKAGARVSDLKNGLMQDLLSGRVSVAPLLESEPA